MKTITTLLCGAAMAASLSTPVLAGGKSTTGSATTVPPAALAAAHAQPATTTTIGFRRNFNLFASSTVANLIAVFTNDFARQVPDLGVRTSE